jgi:acetate kinase
MQELMTVDSGASRGHVIVAHLGNGSSVTAIDGGVSIDTSMGFSPIAGLVMGTRCGDLDPGVLLYLIKRHGMTFSEVNELLNKQSGLLGLSEYSPDMRDLLKRESTDVRCAMLLRCSVTRSANSPAPTPLHLEVSILWCLPAV